MTPDLDEIRAALAAATHDEPSESQLVIAALCDENERLRAEVEYLHKDQGAQERNRIRRHKATGRWMAIMRRKHEKLQHAIDFREVQEKQLYARAVEAEARLQQAMAGAENYYDQAEAWRACAEMFNDNVHGWDECEAELERLRAGAGTASPE